ncbi:rootletin [Ixodes scapularis]
MEQPPENVIARLPSSSTINDEDYATAEEEPPGRTSRLEDDDQQGVLSDACSTDSDHELELVGLDREHELKSKLEKSRTMLRAYVQHTTNQDRLLGHLGAQVEEYRNRCSRLEEALRQCPCADRTENIQDDRSYEEDPPDLPSALSALELERARCAELKQLNVVLREHLEITTETNATLTMHMERMTEDWQNATRADAVNRGSSSSATHDEFRADSEQGSVPRLRRDLQELKGDLGDMRQAFATSLASIQTMLHDAGEAAGRVQLSLVDDAAGSDQPDLGLTRSRDEGVPGVSAVPLDSVAKMVTDDLNHQVEALHRENEGLHTVLASRLETIEQMTNVIDALKAAQCNLGASAEKSSQENVDLRVREAMLQSEVRSHEATSKNLASELESVQREKKECMGVIASLHKHVANLEDQQQRSEREISVLRKALSNIEELNDSLEREMQEMCNASIQLKQSNSELAKAKSDMELAHEELAAERDSLARREADVTRAMARLESLLEESASRQTELEATLSARDKEIAYRKAAFLQLSSQKDALSQEASSLRQSVASQRETNEQLSAQKEELATAKSQLEMELRHCRAEGDKLQSDLTGCKEAREATEVDLRNARNSLAKIQREKETTDAKLRDSAAELEKLHEKLKRLERERKADAEEWGMLRASLTEKLQAAEEAALRKVEEQRRLFKEEMDKHRQEKAGQLRQLEESHAAELKRQEELLSETETKWHSEVALHQQRLEDVRVELQEKLASSEQLRAEMQSMAEDERRELLNSLGRCKEEVSVLRRNLVAFRDEAGSKMAAEQAKVASALKDVDTLRVELEQTRTALRLKEAQEKSRESQFHKELSRVTEERERAIQRLNEADASHAALQRELSEALGKKSEGERRVEVLTHQLSEARQSYTLVTAETEQLRRVIGELQQELRSATQERDASLQEASEKFRGAEKARATLAEELRELRNTHDGVERARQVLERKVRALESALLEHGSELDSLRKLSEQRGHQVESARQDVLSWKRKVVVLEEERDAWQRERASLGRRLDESERRAQAERNAREGVVREAGRVAERLAQDRADLEKQLLASGQATHEARLALCAAQGSTAALESELKIVSESRKSIEGTLDSLLSVLRCSLGIQTKYELRSPSPQRPAAGRRHGGDPSNESFRGDGSPFRSEDSLGRSLLRRPTPDVEAELVLQAVDALSHRIATLEADKEKVEAECERSQRVVAGLEDELAATKSTLARLTKANDALVAAESARREAARAS